MSNASADLFRQLIQRTNAKYFTIKFYKQDGTLRVMRAQMNVECALRNKGKKVPPTTSHIPSYIVVYEPSTDTYKNVNLETMFYFKCGRHIIDLGADFHD